MQVLYLTYDGLTDPLGQSQVLPYIVGLCGKGISYHVISFDKPAAYAMQRDRIKEIVNRNTIKWTTLRYTKYPPFLSTLYDIYKFKRVVKQQVTSNKVELLHCRSYISALVGLWAKKKFGVPFIFDMRGFWADERIDGGIWSLSNPLHKWAYNYFKKKERAFMQEAAYTISLTHKGKEEIESWQLNNQAPIEVIPCCTDENLFNPSKVNGKRKELGIGEDEFVLSYLGSIGTWYLLDEMLDFFKVVCQHYSKAKMLFITKDDEALIKEKATKKGIDINAIVVKSANRTEVPDYIKTSNVSIFFIKQAYSKKASSPTKMGEIMNLGVPIVCNHEVGDVAAIMSECMPKLLVRSFDTNEYSRVIEALNQPIDEQKIMECSLRYYALEGGVEKYYSVYQAIMNTN